VIEKAIADNAVAVSVDTPLVAAGTLAWGVARTAVGRYQGPHYFQEMASEVDIEAFHHHSLEAEDVANSLKDLLE
jgi:hypothetical protein